MYLVTLRKYWRPWPFCLQTAVGEQDGSGVSLYCSHFSIFINKKEGVPLYWYNIHKGRRPGSCVPARSGAEKPPCIWPRGIHLPRTGHNSIGLVARTENESYQLYVFSVGEIRKHTESKGNMPLSPPASLHPFFKAPIGQ